MLQDRLVTCHNERQEIDKYKRVLCVCSAGLIRSATAAVVLSQEPFSFNTRCAGENNEYGLILLDPVLIEWADEFVCMEYGHEQTLRAKLTTADMIGRKQIINLGIPDDYLYREPCLMELIRSRYIERSDWKGK